MTKEEIIALAKRAGFRDDIGEGWLYCGTPSDPTPEMPSLEKFAELVAAAVREACAKIAERNGMCMKAGLGRDIAAQIRASSNAGAQPTAQK